MLNANQRMRIAIIWALDHRDDLDAQLLIKLAKAYDENPDNRSFVMVQELAYQIFYTKIEGNRAK